MPRVIGEGPEPFCPKDCPLGDFQVIQAAMILRNVGLTNVPILTCSRANLCKKLKENKND